ncbi:hypothetical protein I316_08014 [Kwoniella heveanensis BCC8398]|uniref:ABC transporter n=1 Tax=Kwoniella heveanensis BCC8398 TaxID=1296120 RepID=A0A1B9GH32_9TREE|nr:hypothetical protein I316_08014 [Kwoniella heveanensis BCC8398]
MMTAALTYLHYLTPLLLAIPLISLYPPKPPPPPPLPGIRPITIETITPRRSVISTSLFLLALTAFGDIVILVADLLTAKLRHPADLPAHLSGAALGAEIVYGLAGLVVWGLALAGVWWRNRWDAKALTMLGFIAIACEIPNLVCLVLREVHTAGYDRIFDILTLVPSSLRLLLLPILLTAVSYPRVTYEPADESTGLLADGDARRDPGSASEYGTFDTDSQDQDQNKTTAAPTPTTATNKPGQTTAEQQAKKLKITKQLGTKKNERPDLSFKEAWPKFRSLIPKLWPSTSKKLQFYVAMTGVTIAIDRVLTPLSPISMGFVVRALTEENRSDIWKWLGIYLVLRLFNSYGILSAVQQAFWVPVVQYTDREMQMLCFNHLLDLSLAYHTKRNTGEVMRILDRGSAINELFRTVLFQVIPTVADIVIGFSVFLWLFGSFMTGCILLIMIPYLFFTFYSTKVRRKLRTEYIDRDRAQRGIVSDVLLNWESVKYFTAETREYGRFQEAVSGVQDIDYRWTMGQQAIYAIQALMLTLGFAVGAIIIAYNIMQGRGDAALFVIFVSYYTSFTSPLSQLSSLYRSISVDITDSEKMLALLSEKTEIKDQPDAKDLVVTDGVIEFDNVTFSYDGTVDALKNVSFKIGKGQSMALVGETGSGKSTILRLLYRFYDVTSGHIYIDGQDISQVTQRSLRHAIGIVPQDSVLWNDTIGANIAYGKPDATDEEIIEAAKAGKMHDKILAFDEGYDTIVGERGVRLSGGEKQRVSLSRMFLKSPAILVLDEATSALDTETEREIQKSLSALAKGRSSLSIAHRLSTIINSDKIVVMKNGQILESGEYKELIEMNGTFAKMWKRQIYTEAELLEDADVEKVAASLPTIDDFRRAHSWTETKPAPKNGPGNGDDAQKVEQVDSAVSKDDDAVQMSSPVPAAEYRPKPSESKVEGFSVDAPPAIADSPDAPTFADAVKSAQEASPGDKTVTKTDVAQNSVPASSSPPAAELESAATGPDSVVERQDPLATVIAAAPSNTNATAQSSSLSSPHRVHEPIATIPLAPPAQEGEPIPEPAVGTEAEVAPEPIEAGPSVLPAASAPESTVKQDEVKLESPKSSPSPAKGKAFPEAPKPSSSPSVPFPSSASRNPNRLSTMSNSPSIASAMSSAGGSSPTKSEVSSQHQVPADKGDKRRKRLSSIKGFVRRISDQGLTRSPSGLRSPASEDVPPTPEGIERAPLLRSQSQQKQGDASAGQNSNADANGDEQRERKVSTHGPSSVKKKNKKKHGKH